MAVGGSGQGDGVNVGLSKFSIDLTPFIITVLMALMTHQMYLPGIGLAVSAILMLVRWNRVGGKNRSQVLDGIRSKMHEFRLSQHEVIRKAVGQQLCELKNQIIRKIEDDIAMIDGSIKTLITQKERHQASTKPRFEQLDALMAATETELKKIEELIG